MAARWTAALLLGCLAAPLAAQVPMPARKRAVLTGQAAPGTPRADTTRSDTTKADSGRGGLPTAPSRSFATPDSVEAELLNLPLYTVTRYSGDSVQFRPPEKQVRMAGHVLVGRGGTTLEADTARYAQEHCVLTASGSPKLFDVTGVMIGRGMLYDACNHAGLIGKAQTDFKEGSATWFLHGDLAVDNAENRVYASAANITSCDLPDPHYHFAAREVKWVSKTLMVARPAVLYVADVPVMWLPFIFQDMRRNRHSGLIPPGFGPTDIIRNSPTYHRHVSNLGYYWAINDYTDAQVTMDWFSQEYLTLSGRFRYRWLDRFMTGGIAFQDMHEFDGRTSYQVQWQHQQDFSLSSHLTANIDYASSPGVISRNTWDPALAVATIDSRANYTQRFSWGNLAVGGSRTQYLNSSQVVMNLPTVAFTPNPIAISQSVTFSPAFNFSNAVQSNSPSGSYTFSGSPLDSTNVLVDARQTAIQLSTPLQVGRWNWSNGFSIADQYNNQRVTLSVPDPTDTTRRLTRTYDQFFETDVDWTTGIGLPMLLQGSWNLQPSINVVNTTGGPFMLRNRYSGGVFVTQGKRLAYSLGVSPTFYALLPGFGPIARIRHTFSPSISWTYAPSANIPEAYARAAAGDNPVVRTRSLATQTLTFGLNQNFEAKLRPPRRTATDTTGADTARAEGGRADTARAGGARADTTRSTEPQARKIKLLSIQTSAIAIDLEQAKQPGHTGWVSGSLSNTFSTDLLPGFSLSTTHSLFNGTPGVAGTSFHPFLTSLSARFGLGPSALSWLGSLLGLSRPPAPSGTQEQARRDSLRAGDTTQAYQQLFPGAYQRGMLSDRPTAVDQLAPRAGGAGFSASLAFDLSRTRPNAIPVSNPYGGIGPLGTTGLGTTTGFGTTTGLGTTTGIGTTTGLGTTLPGQTEFPGQTLFTPSQTHSTLNGSVTFAPTPHWSVSWSTLYDFQAGKFGSHVLRLDRDLHDWRATFSFVQSPNGNVVFNFTIALIPQPEIKVDYDQQNLPIQ